MYEDMRSVPGIVADPLVWTEKVLQAKKNNRILKLAKKSHHNYVNIKKLGFNVCVFEMLMLLDLNRQFQHAVWESVGKINGFSPKVSLSLTKCTHTYTQSSPTHTSVIISFANWHLKGGKKKKEENHSKFGSTLFFFNLAFTRAYSGLVRCCLSCTAGTSASAVARLCIKCFFFFFQNPTHAPSATRKSLFFVGARGGLPRSVQLGFTVTKSQDLRVAERIGLL